MNVLFEIEFYALPDGRKPVEEFILNLPAKMQVKALDSLEILEEKGTALREPYSKSLGNGIFELRIRFASDITRIFYFFYQDRKIIVTNGYVKKSQKVPPGQLALAKRRKKDYEERRR